MNEKLKELEAQCWYQEPCDFDMRADGLSTIHTKFDREKFAELIVQSCIDVCLEQCDPSNLNYKPSEKFATAIKHRFDIK